MGEHLTDEEFMEIWDSVSGAAEFAQVTGYKERSIHRRRQKIQEKHGLELNVGKLSPDQIQEIKANRKARIRKEIKNGTVVVFGDAHYWPQLISTAHLALLDVLKEIQPELVIANGDIFDGASQSRHSRINWEEVPGTAPEIWACQARMAEIEEATPNAERVWNLGNHCARFESYIASNAPELAKVHGVHLKDHFPNWEPGWSVVINEDSHFPMTIKHRWKGGINAARNNALNARRSFGTGHTHQMGAVPITAYENDTIFGVEFGTLAEPFGPQFEAYTEDGPRNWISGFGVLTWKDGHLLWPEFCRVVGHGKYEFRGEVRAVGDSSSRGVGKGKSKTRTANSNSPKKRRTKAK